MVLHRNKNKNGGKKKFEAYPIRPIRMSDETWESLRAKKLKYGKNWNKFLANIDVKNK